MYSTEHGKFPRKNGDVLMSVMLAYHFPPDQELKGVLFLSLKTITIIKLPLIFDLLESDIPTSQT